MEYSTYSPLDASKDEIRILVPTQRNFQPTQPIDNEIIVSPDLSAVFELKRVSLQDSPEYTCLSYVWGTGPLNHSVTIDGADFSVGQNLFDALCHLQCSDIAPAIWIDSICINQEDVTEKAVRVEKMGTIFSKAKAVIIWLGPQLKHSDAICGTIQQLPMHLAKRSGFESGDIDDFIQAIADVESPKDFVELLSECLHASREEVESGLTAQNFLLTFVTLFANIKWWRRAWVIQEFILAKECFFQLGLRRIDSDALSLMYISTVCHLVTPLAFLNICSGRAQRFNSIFD
jgi:Heterokaryon incompatibility protein (HET)